MVDKLHTTVTNTTQLGRAIAEIRATRGRTQEELSKQLGISQRWISELERAKPVIARERLFDILEYMGATVTLDWHEDRRSDGIDDLIREIFPNFDGTWESMGRSKWLG